jgi:hypothetical protein
MTCFWKGIQQSLEKNDFETLTKKIIPRQPTIKELILFLKASNIKTNNVIWNQTKLSDMELQENFHAVKVFNINNINNGYACSTCDPFLLLICEIFSININHCFLNKVMKYENKKLVRKTITFKSNYGHFWY